MVIVILILLLYNLLYYTYKKFITNRDYSIMEFSTELWVGCMEAHKEFPWGALGAERPAELGMTKWKKIERDG